MKLCARCAAGFEAQGWCCPHCGFSPELADGYLLFAPELAKGSEGFKEEYFDELSSLEERNFWFRSRNKLIFWALRRYFPGAAQLLEVGCGTGFVLAGIEREFPSLELHGSEVFSAALPLAARRLERARLLQMDARNIPFADEFDVVGAFDVLEHIEDDRLVLDEIFKSLRVGGGLILTVPQHRFLWSRQDEYACHVRRYGRRELEEKLAGAGFEIMHGTSFVSLLLPMMMLARLRKNLDSGGDALDELRLNPALNWILERVMDFETMMIRAGFRLPVGGSLLVIARKPGPKGSKQTERRDT